MSETHEDDSFQASKDAKEGDGGSRERRLGSHQLLTSRSLEEDLGRRSGALQDRQQDEGEERSPVIRMTRSRSVPWETRPRGVPTLRRRRLQSFVAGLVADVEEYVGRGGYEVVPDDRDDSDIGCGTSSVDDSPLDGPGIDPALLGGIGGEWWGGGGASGVGTSGMDTPVGLGWMQGNDAEEGGGEDYLNTPLLSEVTLQSPDDGQLLSTNRHHLPPPQEFILRRARSSSAAQYGGNSVARTVVTYLKGMVGSYVLYLPRMFAQGGLIFSALAIVVLSIASTYNMLLLLRCRELLIGRGIAAGSYGEVARAALGRFGLVGVDVSLFLSQLGYCVVYLIFVQQNLGPILRRAFPSSPPWVTGTVALMLVQACIQVPLSWVRRLKYLGVGMLIANVCVFGGLVLIMFQLAGKLVEEDLPENSGGGIVLINPADCLILLGSVVGCFEGIGLVLPIQDAMDLKVRDRLPAALCWTMAGITAFFVAFGAAGYLAYEKEVANFITMDLPDDTVAGTIVRIMYSVGLILTSPLQLFPAIKVLERIIWPLAADGGLKKKAAKGGRGRKWLKNLLRSAVVGFTVLIALVAGSRFDSFTGIVGGVCAVPLALVYPLLFHLSLFGELDTPRQKALHWGLLGGGVLAGVASTAVALVKL